MLFEIDRGEQHLELPGVFETMRSHQGRIVLLDRHMRRLAKGLAAFDIESISLATLQDQLIAYAKKRPDCVFKLMIGKPLEIDLPTRIVLQTRALPAADPVDGIDITTSGRSLDTPAPLVGLKLLDRKRIDRARLEIRPFQEGLMIERRTQMSQVAQSAIDKQHLVCATMGNIFIVEQDGLRTPRLDQDGIRGVMRETLMDIAATLGIACMESPITMKDLTRANSVFISNAVRGIRPLRCVHHAKGVNFFKIDPLIFRLQHALAELGFGP